MQQKNVIIIGGGVIGAFSAYFLLKKGWRVTLVEKGRFGSGASEGNCGLIVPNHVLPLNSWATLLKALKSMLIRDAPLHVKPRLDLNLFKWLVAFASKCGRTDVLSSARGRHALLKSSFDLYPSILVEEGLDCDWAVRGSLHVFRSPKEWHAHAEEVAAVEKFGIEAEKLERDRLLHLEPELGPDVCGGWHYPQTAHLRPEKLMAAMRGMLIEKGAAIIENTDVKGFDASNHYAGCIRTSGVRMAADVFVVASGAWTPRLQQALGCRIPIQPGKGYSLTLARQERVPTRPCFFEEKSVVATVWPDGFRLGGTMEFSGFDDRLDHRRLSALSKGAGQYLRDFSLGAIEKEWSGFRPMTDDGLPIIDWSPRLRNVAVAAGHNMLGLSMGPGTGKLVAEMINQDPPHIEPRPYSVQRFSRPAGL